MQLSLKEDLSEIALCVFTVMHLILLKGYVHTHIHIHCTHAHAYTHTRYTYTHKNIYTHTNFFKHLLSLMVFWGKSYLGQFKPGDLVNWNSLIYLVVLWKSAPCSPYTVLGTEYIRMEEPPAPFSKDVPCAQINVWWPSCARYQESVHVPMETGSTGWPGWRSGKASIAL